MRLETVPSVPRVRESVEEEPVASRAATSREGEALKRVYVAGPITLGCRPQNIRNAILAGERLRKAGLWPYVPHVSELWALVTPVAEADWLELDFAWLDVCDAFLRLPGVSAGSDLEEARACELGIPVFRTVEGVLAWAGV